MSLLDLYTRRFANEKEPLGRHDFATARQMKAVPLSKTDAVDYVNHYDGRMGFVIKRDGKTIFGFGVLRHEMIDKVLEDETCTYLIYITDPLWTADDVKTKDVAKYLKENGGDINRHLHSDISEKKHIEIFKVMFLNKELPNIYLIPSMDLFIFEEQPSDTKFEMFRLRARVDYLESQKRCKKGD